MPEKMKKAGNGREPTIKIEGDARNLRADLFHPLFREPCIDTSYDKGGTNRDVTRRIATRREGRNEHEANQVRRGIAAEIEAGDA